MMSKGKLTLEGVYKKLQEYSYIGVNDELIISAGAKKAISEFARQCCEENCRLKYRRGNYE